MNLAQLFSPIEKIVGLEITSGYLRAVLLEKNKKSDLKITKKSAPLAQGVIQNGRINNKQELSLALKKFQQENKNLFKSRYVILTLPPSFVFYEIMKFPAITSEQINESIELNINTKTLFPFEASEIYYDWEPVESKDPDHQEVAVVFAMKEYIKDWMEVCELAGLEPLAFEIPSSSIARALDNFKDKSGIVIRIIKEGLGIFIVSNNELGFSRFVQLPSAGNLNEFEAFVYNETRKTMHFYQAEHPHDAEIQHAVIISQLTQQNEIADYLAQNLGISIQNARFADSMEINGAYVAAYGAALRGLIKRNEDNINSLMPIGTEETYRKRRLLAYISLWSDIINATSVLLVIMFTVTLFFLHTVNKKINTQITQSEAANAITAQIAELENSASLFNDKVQKLSATEDKIYLWSPPLKKINPALDQKNIIIRNITLPGPHSEITVSLTASTRDDAIAFRKSLEKNELFESVKMPFLNVFQKENINTTISLKIKEAL